jgi:integrase
MTGHVQDRWHRVVDGKRVRTAEYGRGLRWRARWMDVAGKEHSKSFESKADAQLHLAALNTDMARGSFVDPDRGKVKFGEFAESWYASHAPVVKPKTALSYRNLLDSLVLPEFAAFPLTAIEHVSVARWVADLRTRGLSASRVRQAHIVLGMVLDMAVADRRVIRNEARGVKKPKMPARKRHHYLSHGELQALARAAGEYKPLVLLLGYGGLRWGEATALRVSDLDVSRRRLRVERAYSDVGGRLILGETKTSQGREVPLPGFVVGELLPLTQKDPNELLFNGPKGGPVRLDYWRRRVFDPACEVCEISNLTPHGLRHTAASLAVAAGASVKAVQRMLGHQSAAMTLDVYADLFEQDLDAVAEALDLAASRDLGHAPGAVVDLSEFVSGKE